VIRATKKPAVAGGLSGLEAGSESNRAMERRSEATSSCIGFPLTPNLTPASLRHVEIDAVVGLPMEHPARDHNNKAAGNLVASGILRLDAPRQWVHPPKGPATRQFGRHWDSSATKLRNLADKSRPISRAIARARVPLRLACRSGCERSQAGVRSFGSAYCRTLADADNQVERQKKGRPNEFRGVNACRAMPVTSHMSESSRTASC